LRHRDHGGKIAAIAPRLEADGGVIDLDGRLVSAGFIETHIHLDKSCILDRCVSKRGDLAEAIDEAAKAKASFTAEDVYGRASRTFVRGRPGPPRFLPSYFSAISLRCQASSVAGVTTVLSSCSMRRPSFWARTARRRR